MRQAFIAMKCPLRTAIAASRNFAVIVLFLFVSKFFFHASFDFFFDLQAIQ